MTNKDTTAMAKESGRLKIEEHNGRQ